MNRGGSDGFCGTVMLKMPSSCFSSAVSSSPSYRMGLDGARFCRDSVRSSATFVTTSAGERIGNYFCNGSISVLSETRSYDVLSIYNLRHI